MNPTQTQFQAINSNSKSILVLAGPGSGKTATVVARITRLIKEGARPGSILCLTFTRKAALELKSRLAKEVGERAAKQVWAGTFHAISYRILMQWGERIGYQVTGGRAITVITPEESDTLLREIIKAFSFKGTISSVEEAKSILAHDGTEPEKIEIRRIISEYHSRLKESNAVDFDQLLLEVQKLFKVCPDALDFYRLRFDHIFVDEYQDTDKVQYNLHEVLKPKHLFCVGDSDQAIYGWRGANVGIILNFENDHENAEVIRLEECFRCANVIVDRVNALIKNNQLRIEKQIIGATSQDGVSDVCNDSSPEFIANYISEYLAFENPGEIAVIARTHRALEAIEKACQSLNLEVLRVGKTTQEIESLPSFRFMRAYLRLRLNPRDNIAFLTANEIGFKDDLKAIWRHANLAGSSWYEAFGDEKPVSSDQHITDFYIDSCARIGMTVDEKVINYLFENFGEMLAEEWLELYQLKDNHLELEKAPKGTLTLITAHASKGLEWDNVLIADFDEGKFPSKIALRSGNLEEERRLAYVAFSRARKRLLIFHNSGSVPSRFIAESEGLNLLSEIAA